MQPMKAHVANGQIVLDEPAELPEGASVEVHLLDDELSDEERAELEAELDESRAEFERGDFEDARAFALNLAAAKS